MRLTRFRLFLLGSAVLLMLGPAVALSQPRPVVLLTSDPDDMTRLTDEPGRPRAERIAVLRV